MSKSIDNLLKQLLDSQEAQTKALDEKFAAFASEGNTYTERMKKMEDNLTEAMKKVLEMDTNIKEYHKNTGAKVEAMEAQYAKMFEKSDEMTKKDEENHEKSEPESIKKQEEEMEDDEKKKKKQQKKDKSDHIKEDEKELKDEKKMAKGDCEKTEDEEEKEKKASKMPSDKKLIVDGPAPDAEDDSEAKEASNQIGGVYKNQTVGAPQNQKRHKENPLGKPKNAEETLPEAQASEEAPEALASEQAPASVPAPVEAVLDNGLDSKIEEIIKKFASLTAAKPVALEEELNSTKATMAMEVKAKEEAVSKYKALEEKFESLLSKVTNIEKSAKTVEQKAAQIVANQGTDAVAISTETTEAPVAETEADIYKKFASLTGVEQRKYYLANKAAIESQASAVLSGKRS
jgi:hypothetical protein